MQNAWKGNRHRVSDQENWVLIVTIIILIKQLNVEFPYLIIKPHLTAEIPGDTTSAARLFY